MSHSDHGEHWIMGPIDTAVGAAATANLFWMQEIELGGQIALTMMGILFLGVRMYFAWIAHRMNGKRHRHEEE